MPRFSRNFFFVENVLVKPVNWIPDGIKGVWALTRSLFLCSWEKFFTLTQIECGTKLMINWHPIWGE